ncbi:MAG TPA: glycosyltransferase [Sandaracinaceae bacterium LLY-WYZ-13_1]|nr:glycosyltransferase [Sandaracinaceae bacterium LLY-WYZ-13_1]
MLVLPWILLAIALVGLLVFGLGVVATLRHTGRPRSRVPEAALGPVSLLKPIKGAEEGLAENLRSFYRQRYPAGFEVVFATTEPDDEAIPVARAVAAEFPEVPTRFVRSDPGFGLNPKVSNLAGALAGARHDLVLQSDANVRAEPDYLHRVVSELVAEDGHLLSSMVVGVGERSLGAALHNLQLSAFIAPGCCFALTYFGIPCVIGKSMLFRRSDLAKVGGIELVRDILAEDYVLGRVFQREGMNVLLSTTTAENVNVESTVEHFLGRHLRWLKMRAAIHIPGFVADLVANSTALSLLAFLTSGFEPFFGAVFGVHAVLKGLGDAFLLERTRGRPMAWRHRLVAPLRDILMMAIWPYAAFSRSIEWRGVRLRLGWNTRLRPDDGPLPVRVARRVLAPLRG